MPCYHPLKGYKSQTRTRTGKRSIVFNRSQGYTDLPLTIPCQQCVGCRLEKSRQWAIRCMHEASLHKDNCFITLTFNDAHLPQNRSLSKDLFCVEFMNNLRMTFRRKYGRTGIRYYHCGEYGEEFGRPHYHGCMFNLDFPDKKLWKTVRGHKLYTSKILEDLWPYGFSTVGNLTFETAAYTARYVMKKITGRGSALAYMRIDTKTGEILEERIPEYATMSRKPGIGKGWIDMYMKDVYPQDFVVVRGKKMRPPKFYDKAFELAYPSDFLKVKSLRKHNGKADSPDNSPDRLVVRETVHELRAKQLKRGFEND